MIIKWYQKLNPIFWLGNLDDPQVPVDIWLDKPLRIRRILWFIRNPFHNFTFYVIGMADKPHLRRCNEVFSSVGKWNIILPFISYDGKKVYWYFGWRGNRCAFGIKFVYRRNKN